MTRPKIDKQEYTQITIRLNKRIVDYFKNMADKTGMPYQSLINLYLLECVESGKSIDMKFR